MGAVFNILIGATVLLGLLLVLYGIYGLIRGEIYVFRRRAGETPKATGGQARMYGLYYILAGVVWVLYAVLRLLKG